MTEMVDALAEALLAPNPELSTWGLVEALGGRREGVRALALMRLGRSPDGALPSQRDEPDRYREYRSARRQVESWLEYERPSGRAGAKKRRPNVEVLRARRDRVRVLATRRRIALLRKRGARARVYASVTVSDDNRDRELPAAGPGLALSKADVAEFTDPFLEGDFDGAAAAFEAVFSTGYMRGQNSDVEFDDVYWVKIWPEGTEEP